MKDNYDDETTLNLKLMVVLGKLNKALFGALTPDIAANGMTPTQFGVLEALYHKGPLTINEIIEKTLSSSGNMGVVINNLEKSGLVIKKVSQEDKRCRKVHLTAYGEDLISTYFPKHIKTLNGTFSNLSTEEKKQLRELMKKLGTSIGDDT